jgi:hypothetical protein
MVEAVRVGTVLAHDAKAARRWHSRRRRAEGKPAGLTGMALERAIAGLAAAHPEYIVTGA